MTIAACYLSTEGVVLGADSTATFIGPPERHYNHGQKLFEIGDGSTLGIVTWGLGGLPEKSFRTLIAEFSDHLMSNSPANPQDVAVKWRDFFCPSYFSVYAAQIQRYRDLVRITSRTPASYPNLPEDSALLGGY